MLGELLSSSSSRSLLVLPIHLHLLQEVLLIYLHPLHFLQLQEVFLSFSFILKLFQFLVLLLYLHPLHPLHLP